MRKHLVVCLVLLTSFGICTEANAQNRSWEGYGYFGAHSSPGNFGDLISIGAGADGFLYRGLAAGADLGYMFPPASAGNGIGLLSVNPSYHFVNKERTNRIVPFITGGYGLAFRSGTANLANFGGGVTLWFIER